MIIRTELSPEHVSRLHYLSKPVIVQVLCLTTSTEAVCCAMSSAAMYPDHQFTMVVGTSTLDENEGLAVYWAQAAKMSNVHCEVIDDRRDRRQVDADQRRAHEQLFERATAAIAKMEIETEGQRSCQILNEVF